MLVSYVQHGVQFSRGVRTVHTIYDIVLVAGPSVLPSELNLLLVQPGSEATEGLLTYLLFPKQVIPSIVCTIQTVT